SGTSPAERSPPLSFQRPPPASDITGELHQLAIGPDTAVALDGVCLLPIAAGDALGPLRAEELVPFRAVTIANGDGEAPVLCCLHLDRLGLGEQIESETGLDVASVELGAPPDDRGGLLAPHGAVAEQGMPVAERREEPRPL